MTKKWVFASVCLLGLIMGDVGCGGGGGSTSNGSTQPPPVAPVGDFTLSLAQSSISIVAGSITPEVNLVITPTNSFSGTISISGQLPGGFSCVKNSCDAVPSAPSYTVRLQFTTSSSLPAGNYNVTFVGMGAGLTHQAVLSIQVSAFPAITPNRSAFVPTGDISQYPPVFDSLHQAVYAPDMPGNVVHVISTRTHKLIKDVPVPSPAGVDVSADNKLLYVGSRTQYLYVVDTSRLMVVDQVRLPDSSNMTTSPQWVIALSNGQVLVQLGCGLVYPCSTGTNFDIYDPSARSFTSIPASGVWFSTGFMTRSADHSSVYFRDNDSDGVIARYDAATGAVSTGQLTSGNFVNGVAISPDKSKLAVLANCCELDILDANFNVLSKTSGTGGDFLSSPVFSSDSLRVYVKGGGKIHVFNSENAVLLGDIPPLNVSGRGDPTLIGWDDDQHLIGYAPYTIAFVDGSMQPQSLPLLVPSYQALTPDHPVSGASAVLTGAYFMQTPLITFNGVPAANVILSDTNTINLSAPFVPQASDVDLLATFPNGFFLLAPSAYSFSPRIVLADGQVSATNDGGKLTLYGYGFDFPSSQVSLTIGGVSATNLLVNGKVSSLPVPLYSITANVPPGVPGAADINLTTPAGSQILPAAFHYAERTDFALALGASPFQMVYDKSGNRLFWTDSIANTVTVFSLASHSNTSQIAIGQQPLGLSLTPDGSKLLVVTAGDKQLSVVDTATLQVVSKTSTPADPANNAPPRYIVATSGNKAFLLNGNGFGCLKVFQYDLAAGTFALRTDAGLCGTVAAASSDGSRALIGNSLYSAASDNFTKLIDLSASPTGPQAFSSDGFAAGILRSFYSNDGGRNGIATAPDQIQSDIDSNWISGEKFNDTGSLLYLPEKDRIRIFDVRHGNLLRTLMVPDGIRPDIDCMAIDPAGKELWVMTSKGLSQFVFDSDPLSIGEVQNSSGLLTILGSGFAPDSKVFVDGTPQPATFLSSNRLLASVSTIQPGTHQVSVTNADGSSYVLDLAFMSP